MTNLRRKRQDLRALSKKKTSMRAKRKIVQKGGFLSALLPPVLSVLTSLFSNWCSRLRNLFSSTNSIGNTSDCKDLPTPSLKLITVYVCPTRFATVLWATIAVREYVAKLHRYLNIEKKAPDEQTVKFNWATEPVSVQTPVVRKQKRKKTASKKVATRTLQWDQ